MLHRVHPPQASGGRLAVETTTISNLTIRKTSRAPSRIASLVFPLSCGAALPCITPKAHSTGTRIPALTYLFPPLCAVRSPVSRRLYRNKLKKGMLQTCRAEKVDEAVTRLQNAPEAGAYPRPLLSST